VEFGTPLANDDIAGSGLLAAKQLHPQPFTFTVAAVIGTTYSFLVCHDGFAFAILALDGIDFDLGKTLAVTFFDAVPLAAFLLENNDFVAFQVLDYRGIHLCFHKGLAHGNGAVAIQQVNVRKLYGIPRLSIELVDEELLPFLDFELLTSDGYNGVHFVRLCGF
jgi:hypothetical protein